MPWNKKKIRCSRCYTEIDPVYFRDKVFKRIDDTLYYCTKCQRLTVYDQGREQYQVSITKES